jgi:hypothetical protein
MRPLRPTSASNHGYAPGLVAVALVLCLAVSLPGWRESWPGHTHARRTPAVSARHSQPTGAHVAASRQGSEARGFLEGAASRPPRPSLAAAEGGRPWRTSGPDVRALGEAYAALVAVHVQRLRPGAAPHLGHAPADQPPVVTCPLRGPPAAHAG